MYSTACPTIIDVTLSLPSPAPHHLSTSITLTVGVIMRMAHNACIGHFHSTRSYCRSVAFSPVAVFAFEFRTRSKCVSRDVLQRSKSVTVIISPVGFQGHSCGMLVERPNCMAGFALPQSQLTIPRSGCIPIRTNTD